MSKRKLKLRNIQATTRTTIFLKIQLMFLLLMRVLPRSTKESWAVSSKRILKSINTRISFRSFRKSSLMLSRKTLLNVSNQYTASLLNALYQKEQSKKSSWRLPEIMTNYFGIIVSKISKLSHNLILSSLKIFTPIVLPLYLNKVVLIIINSTTA